MDRRGQLLSSSGSRLGGCGRLLSSVRRRLNRSGRGAEELAPTASLRQPLQISRQPTRFRFQKRSPPCAAVMRGLPALRAVPLPLPLQPSPGSQPPLYSRAVVPATAAAATAVTSNRVIRKLRVMNIPFMGLCFLGLKPLVHEFLNSNEINRKEALRYMRQWRKPFR